MIKSNINAEEKEEEKKITERIKKIMIEKELRTQQLQEEQEKRKKIKIEERIHEKKRLDEIKKQMEREVIESKKKREEQLKKAKDVIHENENYKKIQEKKRLLEKEEDKKLLIQQMKSMELRERERVDEMKAKEARIQALIKYSEDHVTKNETEIKRKEEQRFLKEILEREKMEELKEKEEKQKKKEKEVMTLRELESQIREKEKLRSEEKLKNKEFVKSMKKKEEAYKREEQIKADELKKKNIKWYGDIYKQIEESVSRKKKGILMSEAEFMINKKRIDEISECNFENNFEVSLPK